MPEQSNKSESIESKEIVLIGSGIMSSTLGVFLHLLQPNWRIKIFERLDSTSLESSAAWNNAGTGHAAYCELNYTPEVDGVIETAKAISISEQYEQSKQFWTYLLANGILKTNDFIHEVPHYSFVIGEKDVDFLRKRHEALASNVFFKSMEYSEDHAVLKEWFPLMMEGRSASEKVAGTKMTLGTDVDFGLLSNLMLDYLKESGKIELHTSTEVKDISRKGKKWVIKTKKNNASSENHIADFVFVGAGGGALKLLAKSGISEAKGYAGFPVGGQWLRCVNEEVIQQHHAKVYGKAKVGAPPMSVPHLDSRMINGKRELLFGPFAGFSTKFLKNGSFWDLPCSINGSNLVPLMQVGVNNFDLTKYLIQQVMLKPKERVEELRHYYPNAQFEDWVLEIAGQRVQIIKKNEQGKGILQFGTEVVASADGSLSALLGASPGASTAVSIMLNLLSKCFPAKNENWEQKLKEMIPSFGMKLAENEEMLIKVRKEAADKLGIKAE